MQAWAGGREAGDAVAAVAAAEAEALQHSSGRQLTAARSTQRGNAGARAERQGQQDPTCQAWLKVCGMSPKFKRRPATHSFQASSLDMLFVSLLSEALKCLAFHVHAEGRVLPQLLHEVLRRPLLAWHDVRIFRRELANVKLLSLKTGRRTIRRCWGAPRRESTQSPHCTETLNEGGGTGRNRPRQAHLEVEEGLTADVVHLYNVARGYCVLQCAAAYRLCCHHAADACTHYQFLHSPQRSGRTPGSGPARV